MLHDIRQEAKAEKEELEELIEELENIDTDTLTDEQRTELAEMLDSLARAEEAAGNNGQQVASAGGDDGDNAGSEAGDGEGGSEGSSEGGDEENSGGSGEGSGESESGGSGRGTGSSDSTHDYVSIPNDIGDDESLTGQNTGTDGLDYYRGKNGLAWEGSHVSLDSVITDMLDAAKRLRLRGPGVTVVIIFYLLIPKGRDERISSNILWEKLFKNRQSKTFFEKFIHNLLMYLQILILLVLVLALMSPYIRKTGESSGSVVFVLDVSGSMQHKNASGETRLEEAISEIKGYMESADDGTFSLVTNDGTGTALLAVGTSDKSAIVRILNQVSCTDTAGNLSDAVSTAESIGADAADFTRLDGATICVVGEACANVANTFLSVAASDDEDADTLVVAAGLTNYSDTEAALEISLFDGDNLISVRALTIPADESYTCLFEDVESETGIFRTEISNITFSGSDQKDSLAADNITSGIGSFAIGVNATYTYDLPVWATGFLWSGEKCAGYYGEHDGVRQVVLGFDLRESDFALQAEYPVFMANALSFLADSSLLSQNVYEAGERVLTFAQSDVDVNTIETETAYAGLYTAAAGEKSENYVVRFATGSQSDGRITAESVGANVSYRSALVKKQLRTALLIAAIFLLLVEWLLYVRQMRYRGRFYLAVRAVLLLAIALSVFGVTIPKAGAGDTTIFLVDLSESNASNLTEMESYLKSCIETMPDNNQYGIVAFGKTSVVEEFLTSEKHFSGILSAPDATATNLEEAVTRGLSMIPEKAAGRLVFLTDGRQTKGNIASTASAVVTSGAELLSLVYETSQENDAYIEDVTLPSYLYQGDSYSMTVTVESNYETDASLEIWTGSRQTAATQVHLLKGSNRFVLKQTVTGESAESFSVRVVADGDTCEENNTYSAYAVVDSLPRVLVISGMNEDSSAFIKTLTAAGINYQVVSAKNAPGTLDDMLSYRSIILENVYRTDLPEGFLANIETYVQDYGCRLICCGGEGSFALGGYRDTELETVLPVDMDLRGKNELPSLAMVMVIDHSGSMSADAGDGSGATNLDLAIAAAEAAVGELRDDDYVGVLTDGEGETSYFDDLTSSYRDAGVTLSTVAVGYDSDTALLEKLANACNGRYYYSDIASDIPKIFAQEVLLSGDTYLQNGTFSLAVNESHAITQGLYPDGYPMILGYVSATQKSSATVLIASEKDDPILTVMQCGLGHTVAWNTDVTNEWSGPLSASDDYVSLWKRIIDYSAGNGSLGEDTVDVTTAALVQYSDEYKFAQKNDAYTAFIAQYGTQITPEDDIWKKLPAASSSRVELAKWLILFAILWFVLDIGIRRFCFVPPTPHFKKLSKQKKGGSAQPGPAQEKPAQPVTKAQAHPAQSAPQEQAHSMQQSGRKDAASRKQKAKKQKSEAASLDTSALLDKKSRR